MTSAALAPDQGRLFRRLRLQTLRNAYASLSGASRVRVWTMAAVSVVMWAFVLGLSLYGFNLLATNNIGFAGRITGILFDLLFLFLGGMLLFSTGLILYGGLFTSPETAFLLSTPARADRVFAYKFQSAIGFSSWAFILLGSPILLAYGVVFNVSWVFYPAVPVFFLGFLLVPAGVGAVACFLLTNFIPRRRKQVVIAAGVVTVVGVLVWIFRTMYAIRYSAGRDALEGIFGQFAFARSPLTPSHWMTQGLQAAALGDFRAMFGPLCLIWSNALFLYLAAAVAAARLYRRGFDRLAAGGDPRRRYRASVLDRVAEGATFYLPAQTRLLIVKDFRGFRRDPLQWGQLLILAGLMFLYLLVAPRFYREDLGRRFQSGVSLSMLFGVSSFLCAYMARFIFPMLSLEGRKFWILGLLPLDRGRLLWGKFAFAATGSVVGGVVLITAADLLLGMPLDALAVHLPAVVAVALGLSGLSVGFGAYLPNFRERDPSRIAAGFGGTMFVVVGLFFLCLEVGLMAGPYHLLGVLRPDYPPLASPWVVTGLLAGAAVAAVATTLPLRAGERALRGMEF